MKIELHLLQNFAPSNLNRDDTGAPKDCELGGHRRARISSQCQKRAVRQLFKLGDAIPAAERGARTKRLTDRIADGLLKQQGKESSDDARATELEVACYVVESLGLGFERGAADEDELKSEYLLFVPQRQIGKIVEVIGKHRTELLKKAKGTLPRGEKKAPTKEQKKKNRSRLPKDMRKDFAQVLRDASGTTDLALFGRMIADVPDWNVEAACQVAHAISTNRLRMDFDFFTAVDDFKPEETAGSDMMGTIQFNSSCFYRYAVVDVASLRRNLEDGDGSDDLLRRSLEAFVRAFVSAIPSGKQNSMAAHNFPSYALGVVREQGQPISLANAFLKPARPRHEGANELDLVDDSIAKLENYFGRMRDALGPAKALTVTWADRDLPDRDGLQRATTLGDFFTQITERALGVPA
jgi:CRISPR system Cascade subunit CasC